MKTPPGADGFTIGSGGTLTVSGTASNPVTFTAWWDDSVGGDSDGGGATTGGPSDADIRLLGGTVSLSHAVLKNASAGLVNISGCCSATTYAGVVSISDSRLEAPLSLFGAGEGVALTLQRNTFAVANPSSGCAICVAQTDVSGIALAGVDRNTFTGAGPGHVIGLYEAEVPAGKQWTTSGDGGAVIVAMVVNSKGFYPYDGAGLNINGTLNAQAGTVFKATTNMTSIRVQPTGSVALMGTGSAPVIFTTFADDSIAGDSGGDGPPAVGARINAGSGLRIEHSNAPSVTNVVFRHLAVALSVGSLDVMTVTNAKFDHNDYSIRVDRTEPTSPIWAALPCTPPFTSLVDATAYFTPIGLPGLAFDPAEYVGLAVPPEYGSLYAASSTLLASQWNPSVTVGQNYVNWAIYSCPVIPVPPFPVFPVQVHPLAVDPFPSVGGGIASGGW